MMYVHHSGKRYLSMINKRESSSMQNGDMRCKDYVAYRGYETMIDFSFVEVKI